MTSTAVSIAKRFDDETLGEIKSFEDALALFQREGIAVESAADYGHGFSLLKDKSPLVGVPSIIVEWHFNEGDFSDDDGNKGEYVAAYIITKHGDKYVVVDGGTGICRQLTNITQRRIAANHPAPNQALVLKTGLVKSDYVHVNKDTGKETPASTFYLSE